MRWPRHSQGTIRYFRPAQQGGLAVVDIPHDVATALGGLKQLRIRGLMNGTEFTSNTMPASGGVLALSRKLLARTAARGRRG